MLWTEQPQTASQVIEALDAADAAQPTMDFTREGLRAKYRWLEATLRELIENGVELHHIGILEKPDEHKTWVLLEGRTVATFQIRFPFSGD